MYSGIPNKKRRVYVDESGIASPLVKGGDAGQYYIVASSGTLLADGHLTVSGSQFKSDSIATATYFGTTSGTRAMAAVPATGTVTFYGDYSRVFYYTVVNLTTT